MKRICTKCIVAALILSMGITAGIPAYAAQPQTTTATEQAAQLSLEETASQYFENYPSDKHVVSAEQLLNRVEEGESFCLLDIVGLSNILDSELCRRKPAEGSHR